MMKMSDDWMRKNYPELVKFLERETEPDENLEEAIKIVDSFSDIMRQLEFLNKKAVNLKVQ
jgi:hypothetical protein